MSEWLSDSANWFPSKFGPDDVFGTLNFLGPEKVMKAISLVKKGEVISLAHEIYNGMPGRDSHGPFFYVHSQRAYDLRPPFRAPTKNKFGGALCRIETSDHMATHLDSLNHISYDGRLYNGIDSFQNSTVYGSEKLGIDSVPPIVTRGIIVDCTDSGRPMKPGEPISLEKVKKFLEDRKISPERGDAIFFHTGISAFWNEPHTYNSYYDRSPGIGMELAEWIADMDISVTGSDTPATEVSPPEIEGTRLPVHQYLITRSGIRLIDNINTGEAAGKGAWEFLFICAPMKIRGATASPVVPLAII